MANKSYVDAAYDVLVQAYANYATQKAAFDKLPVKDQTADKLVAIQKECDYPMVFGHLIGTSLQDVGYDLTAVNGNMIAQFYTALTNDGRFVIKEGNTWALREHEAFADVHIDMNEAYASDTEEDEKAVDAGDKSEDDAEDNGDEETEKRDAEEEEEDNYGGEGEEGSEDSFDDEDR